MVRSADLELPFSEDIKHAIYHAVCTTPFMVQTTMQLMLQIGRLPMATIRPQFTISRHSMMHVEMDAFSSLLTTFSLQAIYYRYPCCLFLCLTFLDNPTSSTTLEHSWITSLDKLYSKHGFNREAGEQRSRPWQQRRRTEDEQRTCLRRYQRAITRAKA